MRGFGLRAFGLELRIAPGLGLRIKRVSASPVPSSRGGWWPIVREPFAGAWQRNIEWSVDSVLAHSAVFACLTLIANDIAKLRPRLMQKDADGIWTETESSAFSPVLRKPNRYQTRIQFIACWILSKLIRGNTYVLKVRDDRRVVTAFYILDPSRVTVLVTEPSADGTPGDVYYDIQQDNLSGVIAGGMQVPASEIIHDRWNCLFHPLVGVSPIFAAGAAANIGLQIQKSSTNFFARGANPSGVLTAPKTIPKETAERIKEFWESEFSGENAGAKVAVLGDGLEWEPMRMSAVDSQTIEQLKWTAETVASTFHVPPFKIGIGQMPTYQNGELLEQAYYSNCLQILIEELELCLDEGLGIGEGVTTDKRMLGVELDLDALLRMDTASQIKALGEGVQRGIMAPNEARRKLDLKPKPGGDNPFMQQQNWPLVALADPTRPGLPGSPAPTTPPPAPPPNDEDDDMEAAALASLLVKSLRPAA